MDTTNIHPPGPFTETMGRLAYAFAQVQPYLPMYTHLILSALFPIVTGAFSSLSRPSSAAKPTKAKRKKTTTSDDESDSEDGEVSMRMEGLSPSDAIIFPVLAGSTLTGLYFLIKWMGPQMLNKILGWYFSSMAVFSVAKLVNDGLGLIEAFVWPKYYVDHGVVWQVKGGERKTVAVTGQDSSTGVQNDRQSPFPGILGRIRLPTPVLTTLWTLRQLPRQTYLIRGHSPLIPPFRLHLTIRTLLSSLIGLSTVLYATFVSTPWYLTNLQGFAFSYSALQLMSPTSFTTGSMILIALFFYDIYFVFYTPMMVSVASKLDVPIKLLFPRPAEEGQEDVGRKLAMLGLGDVVLPGIVIGLALRFDLFMFYKRMQRTSTSPSPTAEDETDNDNSTAQSGTKAPTQAVTKAPYRPATGHWGNRFWTTSWLRHSLHPLPLSSRRAVQTTLLPPNFPKPYFYAAIAGYVAGMCATLGVMQVFAHAQPALLYLVPGVLGAVWGCAVVRGEWGEVWGFSEVEEVEEVKEGKQKDAGKARDGEGKKKDGDKEKDEHKKAAGKGWFSGSFFGTEAGEKNAKRLEKALKGSDDEDSAEEKDKSADKSTDNSKHKKTFIRNPSNEILFFSIERATPRRRKPAETAPTKTTKDDDPASRHSSSSDDAVLVDEADARDESEGARWRGKSVEKDERAGKRLRVK